MELIIQIHEYAKELGENETQFKAQMSPDGNLTDEHKHNIEEVIQLLGNIIELAVKYKPTFDAYCEIFNFSKIPLEIPKKENKNG